MQGAFMQYVDKSTAEYMAQYSMYGELIQQSTLWGFIEAFRYVGLACLVLIPLVLLIKKMDLKRGS